MFVSKRQNHRKHIDCQTSVNQNKYSRQFYCEKRTTKSTKVNAVNTKVILVILCTKLISSLLNYKTSRKKFFFDMPESSGQTRQKPLRSAIFCCFKA